MRPLVCSLGNMPAPALAGDLPAGLPPEVTAAQITHARELWSLRNEIFGSHRRDGEGDVEDFWEMAARLHAVVSSPADEVYLSSWGENELRVLRGSAAGAEVALEGLSLSPADPAATAFYGPIPESSPHWRLPRVRHGESYPTWPAFQTWARRPFALTGVYLDGEGLETSELMAEWVRTGIVEEGEKVILKANRAKHGIWPLEASSSVEENRDALSDALGWTAVHMEGLPTAFTLQKFLPLTHEYRMFFSGGRAVTGAGCVEEFTPLYNGGEAFDMRTREQRAYFGKVNSEIRENRQIVDRYLAAAEELAILLPPEPVVVDMAINSETGEAVMIEANGLSNSGLYASRPELVVAALLG